MREITLYSGESITIGDTVVMAEVRPSHDEELRKQFVESMGARKIRAQAEAKIGGSLWADPAKPCFCTGPAPGEVLCPCAKKQMQWTDSMLGDAA